MNDSERTRAFDDFYAAHARRLVAIVYAVTGDMTEAEDAVQEAFARAWPRWDRLVATGDPTPWIRTVAMRLAVSTWRKSRNRLRAHFRHGPPADLPGLAPDHVALVTALRKLKPEQRRVVVLHHLLDLPVEEVARETGSTRAAVRTRLVRARRALSHHLEEADTVLPPKPTTRYSPGHTQRSRSKGVPARD
ncbi:SigE family RNA polymerase sigma factor [Streptomyces nanhaiensis]|uniref:SigE family RNA polymerase sigma factor n=1 Tax=Streptomyces nanhaiensis TaxID=679319 RepID=UPI00399C5A45